MTVRPILFLTLLVGLTTGVARANDCSETKLGKCYFLHGRYTINVQNNGIWVIGTKRLLCTAGDEKLDDMIRGKGDWLDYAIVGDFTVCPLTKFEPGHMQSVCAQSYRNIRVTKRQ